jgi:cell division protein FtsZ
MINLDLADIKAVLGNAGLASIFIGEGAGQNRAKDAARAAVSSPLLESPINTAKGVLFSITGGSDLTLFEVNEAASVIKDFVDPDANIIFSVIHDVKMKDKVRIFGLVTSFPIDESRTLKADTADRILAQVFGEKESEIPPFLRRFSEHRAHFG